MGKIFCIIGKSSTGKDTIFRELMKDKDCHFQRVVGYTTRPIRVNETEGVEYHFVTADQRDQLEAEGKIIERRTYNTIHGLWDYFTVNDGQVDLASEEDYLITATLESYLSLRDFYGKDRVLPIYIEVEDSIRLQRALDREKKQTQPKYEEMCRRYLADSKDFSPEKLKEAEVTRIFRNVTVKGTVEEIKQYIATL